MRQFEDISRFARGGLSAPRWNVALRALREASGVTQEGWAARLGYGRRTIQRWEHAELAPDARAAEALIRLCADLGLFREYRRGALIGLTVTADWLKALLGDARIGAADLQIQTRERASAASVRPVLPTPLTTFVGREQEQAEIRQLLGKTRLLTITGVGGVGKTRLAIEVARTVSAEFADGIWLVDLAPIDDPRLVPQAVAAVLGVREQPDRALLATLADRLRDRKLLVLLDSCEHIVAGCAEVVAVLLQECPELCFLATSRVVLSVSGEVVLSVPPLAVPDLNHDPAPETVVRSDAAQLFVQRARAVASTFTLTNETSLTIAEVCVRLDGLPLAIELAAAWMRVLPPKELLRRLADPFPLLVATAPGPPTRQRALRATLDGSYRLLAEPEQRLLARLSVFVGSAALDAIETVGGDNGEPDQAILPSLARLVDASLVQRLETPDAEPRFRLLETVRQYAKEQLMTLGDVEEIRRRHATTFRDLAEKARPHLRGQDLVAWLDQLERDHDNLRAALGWAIEREDTELSGRLAASLGLFWYRRGYIRVGREMLDAALALPAGPDQSDVRVEMLQGSGLLALHHGDYAAARHDAEEGVAIARQLGDPRRLVDLLGVLGFVARVQEDWDPARRALEECLTLARTRGHTFGAAMSLHHLGLIALEAEQDCAAAWSLSQQSLALARRIGDRRLEANVLGGMGRVARAQGNAAMACRLLAAALTAYHEVADPGAMPHVLYTCAAVAADAGQLDRAVRLAAAASRVTEIVGSQEWPSIQREIESWLPAARDALGERNFATAWAQGQATTLEKTVALALAEATNP